MTTIMEASRQWMKRPQDERFTSLPDMLQMMQGVRSRSRASVESTRAIQLRPASNDVNDRGLVFESKRGPLADTVLAPTHYSFGQLCSLASPGNSPAGYFRGSKLPAEIIADCLNANMLQRDVEQIGVLGTLDEGYGELRAATGPNYGRIWNADVVEMLIQNFGDGIHGDFRVPGEFGNRVDVDKQNTTLYASDRDMFVFLADEERRIEVPNRRDGKPGSLARGFFTWNSEVGDKTLGAGFFLFDFVCCNRIVWGADQYQEVRIRHTAGAPDKWAEQAIPVLTDFAQGSARPVEEAIAAAQARRIEGDLTEFLGKRFGKKSVDLIRSAFEKDEGRVIETLWDATTAATAWAREIPNQDRRIEVERAAGDILKLAA